METNHAEFKVEHITLSLQCISSHLSGTNWNPNLTQQHKRKKERKKEREKRRKLAGKESGYKSSRKSVWCLIASGKDVEWWFPHMPRSLPRSFATLQQRQRGNQVTRSMLLKASSSFLLSFFPVFVSLEHDALLVCSLRFRPAAKAY